MALKVFLSYSLEPDEQVIAWRLQTLAAAHGIELYVPHRGRGPSGSPAPLLPREAQSAIDRADCVLAIITAKTQPAVLKELNYARGKNKLIIPIVEAGVRGKPLPTGFETVFRFSANDHPGELESKVMDFLKRKSLAKDQQQALAALVAIGLGMFLLSTLVKE